MMLQNIKEHNPNWPQIPDHSYRIPIIGCFRSRKTNSLFNPINHEQDINKIYLYAKDPYEAKYHLSINKGESTGLNNFNDSKNFNEYSFDINDVHKNSEKCNPNKNRKILIVFGDMFADIINNKKLNPLITELRTNKSFNKSH